MLSIVLSYAAQPHGLPSLQNSSSITALFEILSFWNYLYIYTNILTSSSMLCNGFAYYWKCISEFHKIFDSFQENFLASPEHWHWLVRIHEHKNLKCNYTWDALSDFLSFFTLFSTKGKFKDDIQEKLRKCFPLVL